MTRIDQFVTKKWNRDIIPFERKNPTTVCLVARVINLMDLQLVFARTRLLQNRSRNLFYELFGNYVSELIRFNLFANE